MKKLIILATLILAYALATAQTVASETPGPAKARALVVVDSSVYPTIKKRLKKYSRHIRSEFNIELKVLNDDFYAMKPPEIRAILKSEYDHASVPVVGAIMVGPIPHAIRSSLGAAKKTEELITLAKKAKKEGDEENAGKHRGGMPMLTPAPLYYEDFNAEWIDEDGDGIFERFETDAQNNPTEIWTAWWIPPSDNPATQAMMLNSFLRKLDLYHKGRIDGKDGMIFIAGNGNSVEITESWAVLMNEAMASSGNKVTRVASAQAQMAEKVLPKNGADFIASDLVKPLTTKKWQHLHIFTHGDPAGYYWHGGHVTTSTLNMLQFKKTGANIITTSGCSNGNFRGENLGEVNYARSMGNQLLFSNSTITVAYYGAASPQSTGVWAGFHTELFEGCDPEKGGYLAEGYYNMRNADYSWGTRHYFFRAVDGKILSGDPFARYH